MEYTDLIIVVALGVLIWGATAVALIAAVGFATGGTYPTPPARDTTDQWDVAA